MKPWMLILLLLLSLLQIHEAQGIRLTPKRTHNIIYYKIFQGRSNDIGVEEVFMCKGYHCSGSRVRKLMVSPISSTTTTTTKIQNKKNKKEKGTKQKKLSIDSSSTTEQRQPTVTETYSSILDIAGMDYSQARRKPPIHN